MAVFLREYAVELSVTVGWYVLSSVLATLFGHKTQVEAWCERNPKLSAIIRLCKATGFDVWALLPVAKAWADRKAKLS